MQSGAEQFKDWLGRRGMTQPEAAEILGVDTSYVSLLMNGRRQPGRKVAIKIARLAGIPVDSWESNGSDESSEPTPRKPRQASA